MVFNACVKSVVPNYSDTWAVKEEDLVRLEQSDMRMMHWVFGVTGNLSETISIWNTVQRRQPRWLGLTESMQEETT